MEQELSLKQPEYSEMNSDGLKPFHKMKANIMMVNQNSGNGTHSFDNSSPTKTAVSPAEMYSKQPSNLLSPARSKQQIKYQPPHQVVKSQSKAGKQESV